MISFDEKSDCRSLLIFIRLMLIITKLNPVPIWTSSTWRAGCSPLSLFSPVFELCIDQPVSDNIYGTIHTRCLLFPWHRRKKIINFFQVTFLSLFSGYKARKRLGNLKCLIVTARNNRSYPTHSYFHRIKNELWSKTYEYF